MNEYQDLGLSLVVGENAVEAGIHRVQGLMSTGRFKVFNTCLPLLAELRKYQRTEDGKIRKQDDHLLDALRYVINTERAMARPRPRNWKPKVRKSF